MAQPPKDKKVIDIKDKSKAKDKAKGKKNAKGADKDNVAHVVAVTTGRPYSRRAGDVREAEKGSAIWLVSFTDVMALMLTFFVMLFAISEPEKEQWSDIILSLESELNSYYGPAFSAGANETISLSKANLDRALDIGYLKLLIKEIVDQNEILNDAVINQADDHLVISLPNRLLFAGGDAEPLEDGLRALYALGGALSRIKNKIEIVGHADPRPIGERNEEFTSNWELSLARALNVAAVMENVGYDKHITVRGLSDGRYQDIGNTMSEDEKLALSRRVDILVMSHDGRKDDIFSDRDFK